MTFWKAAKCGAGLVLGLFAGYALFVAFCCIVAAFLSGCGAAPEQSHGGRAWCCEIDEADPPYLACGGRHRVEGRYCECDGLELGTLCMDPTPWESGTYCTDADLTCW